MNGDFESAHLSDGTRIAIVTPSAHGEVLAVRRLREDRVVAEAAIPYPSGGVGGGRVIVSPRERFVLLSMFSGQSEEGYALFRLGEGIDRVGGLPYQHGEAASYGFSADESVVVMALPFACIEWWTPWEDGEAEPDGAGRLVFDFGQLRVHDIESGNISVHELRVSVPESWTPSRLDYDPYLHPRFVDGRRLALSMPWGKVEVPMPLPGMLTLFVD